MFHCHRRDATEGSTPFFIATEGTTLLFQKKAGRGSDFSSARLLKNSIQTLIHLYPFLDEGIDVGNTVDTMFLAVDMG